MLIYVNLCKLDGFVEFWNQLTQSPRNVSLDGNTKITFLKSVSKRPNLCRNDSYMFGQKYVSVSKWHCVKIVCVEVTGTPSYDLMLLCRVYFLRQTQKNGMHNLDFAM